MLIYEKDHKRESALLIININIDQDNDHAQVTQETPIYIGNGAPDIFKQEGKGNLSKRRRYNVRTRRRNM